ncbi:MAG: sulfotransferase domain-containing protein [Candidatus Schekmanbacteria bacterium]|nr:sulfotransferase domain-containing protein [Candidatus Schekmanbacteria bacterium]
MPRTIWLASYPKSGNTWLRVFLANLLFPEQAPVDIASLPLRTPIAADRRLFDTRLGIPSAFLTPEEIARLRPEADREVAAEHPLPLLLRKVHDAYTRLADGRPLLGSAPDFAAIYILRDPLDVAASAANHWGCSADGGAERMLDPTFGLARGRRGLPAQLPQTLLSWSAHVLSWIEAPMPIHLMRFRAMRESPLPTFRAAVRFLGLEQGDGAIAAAIAASSFENLRAQESAHRFPEAPRAVPRFFRSGGCGDGARLLSPALRQALERESAIVETRLAALGL